MTGTPPRKKRKKKNLQCLSRRKIAKLKSNRTQLHQIKMQDAIRIVDPLRGCSFLQKACRDGDENKVHRLLEGCSDTHILRRDNCGETALHEAIRTENTECCMLLLNHLENPLDPELYKELLNLCGTSMNMSVVADKLTAQVFQSFEFMESQGEELTTTLNETAADSFSEEQFLGDMMDESIPECHNSSASVTSFDDLKEQLCANIENLRCLWEDHKDVLFSFNQYLANAKQIGGHFLPLLMFVEAAKSKINQNKMKSKPQASRTTKLFLAYCYRQFGKQFLSTLRDVQFHIPSEGTLRKVDIPPGYIAGILEEAIKKYGPDKKPILSNDERKKLRADSSILPDEGFTNNMKEQMKTEVKSEQCDDFLAKSAGFICPTCAAHFLLEEYFIEHISKDHSGKHGVNSVS